MCAVSNLYKFKVHVSPPKEIPPPASFCGGASRTLLLPSPPSNLARAWKSQKNAVRSDAGMSQTRKDGLGETRYFTHEISATYEVSNNGKTVETYEFMTRDMYNSNNQLKPNVKGDVIQIRKDSAGNIVEQRRYWTTSGGKKTSKAF